MGTFGWSYPPGCSGPPDDAHHPLAEELMCLLEDAGVGQETIDRICRGIDELAGLAERECPECLRRWVAAQMEETP